MTPAPSTTSWSPPEVVGPGGAVFHRKPKVGASDRSSCPFPGSSGLRVASRDVVVQVGVADATTPTGRDRVVERPLAPVTLATTRLVPAVVGVPLTSPLPER